MKTLIPETEISSTIPTDTDEEPPSSMTSSDSEEEPPPFVNNRQKLFPRVSDRDWKDSKWHFRNRITSVSELAKFISLSDQEKAQLELVTKRYPLAITPYYLSLIDPADPNDPIRKQAIPSIEEITMFTMGTEDPLEERKHSMVPGLVHRYPDRVLMVLTDICPMLCRHCTRKREWQNGGWTRSDSEIEAMLGYIREHREVRDVIISGGDPLTLSNARLKEIIARLRQIKHVEILRIGTRFPVVLPQRIDKELCNILSQYGPIWLNTHFNHYRELTPESAEACDRLLRAGVPVNNQSVLLRGVNDSVEVQKRLCQGLLKIKVRPYYLFQCDEIQGTEHLRTSVETGLNIIEGLRGHTSGLAVPTYVIDLPEGGGKVSLQPNYVLAQTKDELLIRNYQRKIIRYRNPGRAAPSEVLEGIRDADRVIVRS